MSKSAPVPTHDQLYGHYQEKKLLQRGTPVFTQGKVYSRTYVTPSKGQQVVKLSIIIRRGLDEPHPGQFFMLRVEKSKMLLGRPISVFSAYTTEDMELNLEFLILVKGEGTRELANLNPGDKIELLGPLGNEFPMPNTHHDKACFVGGGIGVAPVAGMASRLPGRTYDFYACFKESPYGLERIHPFIRAIATESGESGTVKGILSDILDADILRAHKYTVVYACGPTPMLGYVKKICDEAQVIAYLSMESHMACGVGACLGCSISTYDGKKKVCKDGPVFPANIIRFAEPKVKPIERTPVETVDLSVKIAGVKFKNPVIAASGTFGFGTEYEDLIDVSKLGGICSKGLTFNVTYGNSGVRVYEVPGGMLNSIGLENPGVEHFVNYELPKMKKLGPVVIANLSGHSYVDYLKGTDLLENSTVDMIELNISCPNVAVGGMTFGMDPEEAFKVTKLVRGATTLPLIVKLTPNAMELEQIIIKVVAAGADAISLVNTFQAMAIDIETGRPVFKNTYAGLSGPGIKPIALRMVHQAVKTINEYCHERKVPVIGLGGITTWQDAVEFIMAGASAIQVGTATFSNPNAMLQIISGLENYMKTHGYSSIEELRGVAL